MRIIFIVAMFLVNIGVAHSDPNTNPSQRVCVVIDKNAHNSIWTKRDNTAKFHLYGKYKNSAPSLYRRSTYRYSGSNKFWELRYGQKEVCENVPLVHRLFRNSAWIFDNKIMVGVQYGGDCEANYDPKKTIYATIHHRRGNLIEPWSCTIR